MALDRLIANAGGLVRAIGADSRLLQDHLASVFEDLPTELAYGIDLAALQSLDVITQSLDDTATALEGISQHIKEGAPEEWQKILEKLKLEWIRRALIDGSSMIRKDGHVELF
ncbi:MAG: hypothetical protein Q4G26_13655 [Paracoccus sp. (in: a-proteobacteria)]|nr:hypothetical protein [Paracoccus sp. (in: a-proteobacteria)]